jgi:hypothetical protein
MGQESIPLHGELVITSPDENRSSAHNEITAMKEQTRLMVEEAAYYLAKKRGFTPGHELEDWFQAEAQVKKDKLP